MRLVSVTNDRGRCRIRVNYKGNIYTLTDGDYSNPTDRERMERILLEVREEIRSETFQGFDKWKKAYAPINKKRVIELLGELPQGNNVKGAMKHVRACKHELRNTAEFERLFSVMDVSTETKRRYYTLLRSIPELKEIVSFSIKKPKTEESKEIDPFTENEVSRIVKGLQDSHYQGLVLFMLHTGCRTSEAIGIRWSDVDWDNARIRFSSSLPINPVTGKRERKTTKTGRVRFTPMSRELAEMLSRLNDSKHSRDVMPESLIFTSPEGEPIDGSNFLNREWKPLLGRLGIRYRRPYNLRHTFITHCLRKGVDVATVALWVGNSAEVIYRHYAGAATQMDMPELFRA